MSIPDMIEKCEIGLAMLNGQPAICLGIVDKDKAAWKIYRIVTKSCVEAVRDMYGYFLTEKMGNTPDEPWIDLTWGTNEGKIIRLRMSIEDAPPNAEEAATNNE